METRDYHTYLQSLDKQELIRLLYAKKKKGPALPKLAERTVALRLSYDGTNYSGVQTHDGIRSIEDELTTAMQAQGIGSAPVFCGRTDAGVSAINMVVSITAISRLAAPNRTYAPMASDQDEYPYDKIINEQLPPDIRVTGWAPVPDDFSARHSCVSRTYKYFLVLKGADLGRIQTAIEQIRAMTNFYALSTHSNPRARYDRRVDMLTIERVDDAPPIGTAALSHLLALRRSELRTLKNPCAARMDLPGYDDLYCITVSARSFLHNMVRKIIWALMSCGAGNEFSLRNVRIADAHPLVFAGAAYAEELHFYGNRYSLPHFEAQEMRARIMHQITKLRLLSYYK